METADDGPQKILAGRPVDVPPLAVEAGVGPATLYRAVERGEIEAIKIGSRIKIPAHVARKLLRLPDPPVAA